MSHHYFVNKISRNIIVKHRYQCSFELPSNKMSLICSYLLPSFSFVSLEKMFLLIKVYSGSSKIYKHLNYKSF